MSVIAKSGDGFLYLISKTGITGSDGLDLAEIKDKADSLRSVTDLPVCVGFGISTPEDVAAVAGIADGVVIGSAFERIIETRAHQASLIDVLSKVTRSLKDATKK
jgi:tryptophan synthase alpha chain